RNPPRQRKEPSVMSSRQERRERKQKQLAKYPKVKEFVRPWDEVGEVVVSPRGKEKMSEVLLEFVEPHMHEANTPEAMRALLRMGTIAWNAAIIPEDKREELLRDALDKTPPEQREIMEPLVRMFIQRKLQFFADNKRMILDYQLSMTPTGPHVQVISSL